MCESSLAEGGLVGDGVFPYCLPASRGVPGPAGSQLVELLAGECCSRLPDESLPLVS